MLDLAIKRNGDVIICDSDGKVSLGTEDGTIHTWIKTGCVIPSGICLTETDEIVLCMKSKNNDKGNHLAMYSGDDEKKLMEIHVKDSKGKNVLSKPYRVAVSGNNFLVVNDGIHVVKFDNGGRVEWIYDGSQAKLNKKFYPRGLCVDKFSNILITDYDNRCVHYIDSNWCLIDLILISDKLGLIGPWGICVQDVTGEIWIGSGGVTNILVASYLKS